MCTRLTTATLALSRARCLQIFWPSSTRSSSSHNVPERRVWGPLGVILLACLLPLQGCSDNNSEPGLDTNAGNENLALDQDDDFDRFNYTSSDPQGLNDLDLGGDWAGGNQRGNVTSGTRTIAEGGATTDAGGGWGILLKTFSGPGHASSARTMIEGLGRIDPELTQAYVRSRDSGSLVLFGRYEGPGDTLAQSDLDWVKSIQSGGRPVFPLARLAPIQPGGVGQTGGFQPGSLMSARAQYPEVDPLYTIEVAVWIASQDTKLTESEVKRRAEAYAAELRTRNVQAFFHHDEIKGVSSVTVGLFNSRAINPRTNEVTGSARELMMQFPYRLNNGEPLEIYKDPNNPALGSYPQRPELVLVPRIR